MSLLPKLQGDSGVQTVRLLIHISHQLQNASIPAFEPEPFTPSTVHVVANGLFLSSLAFLLVTAFLAWLVKGWIRDFDRCLPPINVPEERAREHERRLQSLISWRLPQLVAFLPAFIQVALVLYCAGLFFFLLNVHAGLSYLVMGCLAIGALIYIGTALITVFDPLSPFPFHISRRLSGIFFRAARWLKGLTVRDNELGGTNDLSGKEETHTVEGTTRVMNELAERTLIARENAMTFQALISEASKHSGINPLGSPKWPRILSSTILPLSRLSDPSIIHTIMRIVIVIYAPGSAHYESLFIEVEKHLTVEEGPKVITGPLRNIFRDVDAILRLPMTRKLLCDKIRASKLYENLHLELSWVQTLFFSDLYIRLSPNFRQAFISEITDCVEKLFGLAFVLIPADSLHIFKAAVQIGHVALTSIDGRTDLSQATASPRRVHHDAPLFEFTTYSQPSNDRINVANVISFFESVIKSETPLARLSCALCFPLHNLLPNIPKNDGEALIQSLEATVGEIAGADAFTNTLQIPGHFRVMEVVSKRLSRAEFFKVFKTFIMHYDLLTKDPSIQLNTVVVGVIETSLKYLISPMEPPMALTSDPVKNLWELPPLFYNRWLALHLDTLTDFPAEFLSPIVEVSLLRPDWPGDPACEDIASKRLDRWRRIPDLETQFPLLAIFALSKSFRTATVSLFYLALGDYPSEVKWHEERRPSSRQLQYPVPAAPLHMQVVWLTRIMTDLFTTQPSGETQLLEDWGVMHDNVYFGWPYVAPEFRTAFVAVFREHKGIDWFRAVSSVLKRKLGLGDETGVQAAQEDHQGFVQDAANLVPFLVKILEAFEPAITDIERKSLGDLGFGESPEAFGDDESRNRIKMIISSSAEN